MVRRIVRIIVGVFAGLVILGVVGALLTPTDRAGVGIVQNPLAAAPVITRAEYGRIQTGMTYEQVVEVIGVGGVELSRNQIGDLVTVMYSWTNENGSNMNAMFQKGELIQKAQFGLE